MANLPIGAREIFKSDFLPSYFDFLGSRTRPFDMSENRLVVEQQFIWDTFLESFPVNITPRSPVYNLVRSSACRSLIIIINRMHHILTCSFLRFSSAATSGRLALGRPRSQQ